MSEETTQPDNAGTGSAPKGDYWYNVETGGVEVGAQSDWTKLLGPYASREEAMKAMDKVHQNNEAWDSEEES